MYGISPQNSRVVFGQLLGMADYISLPLGILNDCDCHSCSYPLTKL